MRGGEGAKNKKILAFWGPLISMTAEKKIPKKIQKKIKKITKNRENPFKVGQI